MKFKVGDRVRIREDCVHYGRSIRNPANTGGVVTKVTPSVYPLITVEWPGVGRNRYREIDLDLVEKLVMEI